MKKFSLLLLLIGLGASVDNDQALLVGYSTTQFPSESSSDNTNDEDANSLNINESALTTQAELPSTDDTDVPVYDAVDPFSSSYTESTNTPATPDSDGTDIPAYDAADSDAAVYTPTDASATPDVDGADIPAYDTVDSDSASYTPSSSTASTALENSYTSSATIAESNSYVCAKYYEWSYQYGDEYESITPELVEVKGLSVCSFEIDADHDGLSTKIDPDDSEPTTWFKVQTFVQNPEYLLYKANTTLHYRFIQTLNTINPTLNSFGTASETPGITDWSQAISPATTCGGIYGAFGICILTTSTSSHQLTMNPENTNIINKKDQIKAVPIPKVTKPNSGPIIHP